MSDSISPRGNDQGTAQAGHYFWVVLSLLFSANLAQSCGALGIPVLYPFIQNEFGLSRTQIGLITSSYAIGIGVTVVLAGWLTDSFGVKRMVIISLLGVATFFLAFPLAYSFPVIIVLAAFAGIFSSSVYPATARAIMDWFPQRIRALAMGFVATGFPVGGALTAAALPTLAVATSWRIAAAAMGLLVLVIAIVFKLMYRDAPRSVQAVHKFNLDTFRNILQNYGLVTTILWGAAFLGLYYIVLTYFMLFLIEKLGLSTIMAGGLLAIAQVTSSISRVLWGAASDFVFHGRRVVVLAITGFLTVAWMLGASLMSIEVPSAVVYLMAIAIGISTLSFHAVLTALIGEQAKTGQVGVTIGVASMMNHASMMIMPPLFGYLVDMSSSYSLAWRMTAALALVCTLALLTFGREPQRR